MGIKNIKTAQTNQLLRAVIDTMSVYEMHDLCCEPEFTNMMWRLLQFARKYGGDEIREDIAKFLDGHPEFGLDTE